MYHPAELSIVQSSRYAFNTQCPYMRLPSGTYPGQKSRATNGHPKALVLILIVKQSIPPRRRNKVGGKAMLQKLADKVLSLLIPSTQAAATYTETYYNRVQGGPGDGCAAYGYRWRQVRTCTYMDSGKLIDCTNWAYYACGW